jgi:hypothetical protein
MTDQEQVERMRRLREENKEEEKKETRRDETRREERVWAVEKSGGLAMFQPHTSAADFRDKLIGHE